MAPLTRRFRSAGFSLLEAQVAFVIVAIVLAVVYQSTQSSLQSVVRVDNLQSAVNLAQNLLVQFSWVTDDTIDISGDLSGDPVFSWHVRGSRLSAEGSGSRLAHLRIVITWVEAGRLREFALETAVPYVDSVTGAAQVASTERAS